jgi:hypothetical protein
MRPARILSLAAVAIAAAGCLQFARPGASGGNAAIEFRIEQDMDIILFSDFGEPAQFAIWLEDPATHAVKTVFVTRRSATGDWVGKAECPASLPRWFDVWRHETGQTGLPRADAPAPDGVSGPTPKMKDFTWAVEVAPGTEWICWIEVNIAADFNQTFMKFNEKTGVMDTDFSGQPSLLYRAEITATPGNTVEPALFGHTLPGSPTGEVQRDTSAITTAKNIFSALSIRVVEKTAGWRL